MAMPVAQRLAKTIINGFDAFFADYQNVTLGAKARFEQADWQGAARASADRLEIYKRKVAQVFDWLATLTNRQHTDLQLWHEAKRYYNDLLPYHANYEIAETFFNSIFCEVFHHENLRDDYAYVLSSQMEKSPVADLTIYNSYHMKTGLPELVQEILEDYRFDVPFENLQRDVDHIVDAVKKQIMHGRWINPESVIVDVLEPVFYRNKGAYLVGRIYLGAEMLPFLLPIMNNEEGAVYVDTLLCTPEEVSVLFSFTRSFFMVDAQVPSHIVAFLKSLMPQKKIWELYSCIGFKKHGKTEFIRDFIQHMQNSDDQFIIAPGIKGMVMSVFTLPSYGLVFKVIKDHFTPPKEVTHQIVREKYKLVTRHDRVGRMADTQEFANLRLPLQRFSPELLEELYKVAPSLLHQEGDDLVIRHVYTERRMTPLNIYLANANEDQIWEAMDEYGNAIRQLAAANIFPGDMLLKNFGVTRHGRVVFYDYDEIVFLTECNFREIPEPANEEQAMSSQPWYSVAENDVFPEEFRLFFSGNPVARKAFEAQHSELYQASYWRKLQDDIRAGKVVDVFPYRRKKRFVR